MPHPPHVPAARPFAAGNLRKLPPMRATLLAWVVMIVVGLAIGTPRVGAEPNFFEKRRIEAQAIAAFLRMITLWQEEVYFELYGEGTAASKERLDQESFAQRMVELSWVPNGELNPKHLKADYRFRTMVYISARVPYRHKFNPDQRFTRDQTMILLREDDRWRVDLVELIRSPYSGG